APRVEAPSLEDAAPVRDLLDGRIAGTRVRIGGTQLLGHTHSVADPGAGPRAPRPLRRKPEKSDGDTQESARLGRYFPGDAPRARTPPARDHRGRPGRR